MASTAPSPDPSLDAEWEEWKKKFERTYSPDEEGCRRAVWENNKKYIEKHNADYEQGKTSYSLGLNQFSDMSEEELGTFCCGKIPSRKDLLKSEEVEENSHATPVVDQLKQQEEHDWQQ